MSRASLSHGTPPNIHRANYDVPLPSLDQLTGPESSETRKKVASSFHYLCSLTQVLGEILPLVYALRPNLDSMEKDIRRLECRLDEWEDGLPHYLRRSLQENDMRKNVNGSSSLWFCFLSLKLLVCRVALRVSKVAID